MLHARVRHRPASSVSQRCLCCVVPYLCRCWYAQCGTVLVTGGHPGVALSAQPLVKLTQLREVNRPHRWVGQRRMGGWVRDCVRACVLVRNSRASQLNPSQSCIWFISALHRTRVTCVVFSSLQAHSQACVCIFANVRMCAECTCERICVCLFLSCLVFCVCTKPHTSLSTACDVGEE